MASTTTVARAVGLHVIAAALLSVTIACGGPGSPQENRPPTLIQEFPSPEELMVKESEQAHQLQLLYGNGHAHYGKSFALQEYFEDPEGEPLLVYSASTSDTEVLGVLFSEIESLPISYFDDLHEGTAPAETGPQMDEGNIMLFVFSALHTGRYAEAEGKSATITVVAMDSEGNETTAEFQVNLIPGFAVDTVIGKLITLTHEEALTDCTQFDAIGSRYQFPSEGVFFNGPNRFEVPWSYTPAGDSATIEIDFSFFMTRLKLRFMNDYSGTFELLVDHTNIQTIDLCGGNPIAHSRGRFRIEDSPGN